MYAGFYKIDITPEPGMPMAGYVNRRGRGIGAHDPLYARVLYLSSGDTEILLVVLDVIRVDDDLRRMLVETVAVNHGLKPENVFVVATHTHSGPEVSLGLWSTRELGEEDAHRVRSYIEDLVWKVNNAVSKAMEHAEEVKELGVASVTIGGVATNRIDWSGTVDKEAVVLRVAHGVENTIIINYACHPTVLGPDNLLYSGDLAGLTVKHIEDNVGINAVFVNGAAGNVSTRFSRSRQDFGEALNLSRMIAEPIIRTIISNSFDDVGHGIDVRVKRVKLKLREPTDPEKLDEIEEQLTKKLVEARSRGAPPGVVRALESDVYAIQIAKRRNHLLRNMRSVEIELRALSIGELIMVFFPGELFVEYQLEVKERARPRKAMVVGYANGYVGYVPHPNYVGKLCYEEIVSLIDSSEYEKVREALVELVEGR